MNRYQTTALSLGIIAVSSLINCATATTVNMSFTTLPAAELTATYTPAQDTNLIFDQISANTVLGTLVVKLGYGAKYRDIHLQDAAATSGLLTFKNTTSNGTVQAKVASVLGDNAVTVNGKEGANVSIDTGGSAVLKVYTDRDYTKIAPGTYSDSVTITYSTL
ncbi:TPA: hypothetical protein ON570_004949 [Citrobacter werkmanii]|nr:hypothetical protein [Citrobacter werkmanii]